MKWISTRDDKKSTGLRDVLLNGLAPDGGLYMPETFPEARVNGVGGLQETAFQMLKPYFGADIPDENLNSIVRDALDFPVPLHRLSDSLFVLELFHGPTLAFKDVGARVMAGLMGHFFEGPSTVTILAATSGDTGSAVASAFLGKPGFRVVLLYPSGKVSPVQEQQLSTFGSNVTTLDVNGTFDDCQRLVKQAFNDRELRNEMRMTSANSINVGRWLPQAVYYLHGFGQLKEMMPGQNPVISVPSGNLGNVAAGLLALRHGLSVEKLVSACNANKVFLEFLSDGEYRPKPSVRTLSNAMDVGNPSNFERIRAMYGNNANSIRADLAAYSHTDDETLRAIRQVYEEHGYIMDPHTAVGYLSLMRYRDGSDSKAPGIVLSTAHPAKFGEVIEKALGFSPGMPPQLASCFERPKQTVQIECDYGALKAAL